MGKRSADDPAPRQFSSRFVRLLLVAIALALIWMFWQWDRRSRSAPWIVILNPRQYTLAQCGADTIFFIFGGTPDDVKEARDPFCPYFPGPDCWVVYAFHGSLCFAHISAIKYDYSFTDHDQLSCDPNSPPIRVYYEDPPRSVSLRFLIFALAVVLVWMSGNAAVRRVRSARRARRGLCRKCGYNLTGNVSGDCSECGLRIRAEGR